LESAASAAAAAAAAATIVFGRLFEHGLQQPVGV
jgi:hypothetical protein